MSSGESVAALNIRRRKVFSMEVTVLLISHLGDHKISLLDSEERAWSELLTFVDTNWSAILDLDNALRRENEEDRVAAFFAAAGSTYVIARADLSSLSQHVDI